MDLDDDEYEIECEDCGAPYGSSWPSCPHCEIDGQRNDHPVPTFTQKKMCKQCPFRKNSAQGWLGDYTASEIIQVIRNEEHFYCHSKVDYDKEDWKDTLDGKPHCAGALQMSKNMCKMPREKSHGEAVRNIVVEGNHIGSVEKFIKHHTNE